MADKKKSKELELVEKVDKEMVEVGKMTDTTEADHQQAFIGALDVIKDDKGTVDYDRLTDTGIQQQFAEKMADHYIKRAKTVLKSDLDPKKDKNAVAMLTSAYAGVTVGQLRQYVAKYGSNFKLPLFQNISGELMDQTRQRLADNVFGQLTREHIITVAKYTGAHVDPGKMNVGDAAKVLGIYLRDGSVPDKAIKNEIFYKKPEKKAD